ncbi:MAG: hypothetical protein HY033_04860 [Ignavibacteriae bacterium]|nr:hypothetical protein [Ignavibacteria bacterium]MBI3364220.1 hypothetical protein [Ignavibacteriota bacterium]
MKNGRRQAGKKEETHSPEWLPVGMVNNDILTSMHFHVTLAVLVAMLVMGVSGCSPSKPEGTGRAVPPPSPEPEPSPTKTYAYRAITDNCNCTEYSVADAKNNIEYRFRATYKMDTGIITSIEIEVHNNNDDTLHLDHGTAKVSSRNVAYQYNDRFVPLPDLTILPKKSDTVKLTGKERTDTNDWHKIAGEQLTITIRGLRLGESEVKSQSVTFVPENPMIQQR